MTRLKKAFFGILGTYLLLGVSLVQAQNAPQIQGPSTQVHSGQRIQAIYKQLGLTDEQKQALEANKQKHRASIQSLRQQLKTSREALKEALMAPQLDMARINQIHDQIKALQSQLEDIRLNSILAVRAILTPDQFSEFVELTQAHQKMQKQQ